VADALKMVFSNTQAVDTTEAACQGFLHGKIRHSPMKDVSWWNLPGKSPKSKKVSTKSCLNGKDDHPSGDLRWDPGYLL